MSDIIDAVTNFFAPAFVALSGFRITDALDIFILAFLTYKAIQLIRQTRAEQLLKGIFMLIAAAALAALFQLNMLQFVLEKLFEFGFIALIIIFQPEFRRALETVGRTRFSKLMLARDGGEGTREVLNSVCKAVSQMSGEKIGALIVIEGKTRLSEIGDSGTVLDSKVERDLIRNIFFPNSPLHDGAVILRENRIFAAACILPLTEKNHLSKELGTRHRAAIGITEISDALAIVVSEETGVVSVAVNGQIERDINASALYVKLENMLIPKSVKKTGRKSVKKQGNSNDTQ